MKPHDKRVFLVRMWRERDSRGTGTWRGSVHDVETGIRFYVSDPREVTDFITLSLAEDATEPEES